MASDTDKAIKELADGLYHLARAVEEMARQQSNTQAQMWAARGKRAGRSNR